MRVSIISLVDIHNLGEMNPIHLKVIIAFISEMKTKEKWLKMAEFYPQMKGDNEIPINLAWDYIYFWSSILIKNLSEIHENKELIINSIFNKFQNKEKKIISTKSLIYEILEMPETSFFSYLLRVPL